MGYPRAMGEHELEKGERIIDPLLLSLFSFPSNARPRGLALITPTTRIETRHGAMAL